MLILDALHKKSQKISPVWLMRQAGRFLPEYREVRSHYEDFMAFCYAPKEACKVTLQPISRFDFDAAIIFSDILVIPDALGQKVSFSKDHGPSLEPFKLKYTKDFQKSSFVAHLEPVYEAISLCRSELLKEKALFGFSGTPWTLACYMVEEGKSEDFREILKFCHTFEFSELLEILTKAVCAHLSHQIKAGADVVQIFDSWASIAPLSHQEAFLIQPFLEIVAFLQKHHPQTPIIYYSRCAKELYRTIGKKIVDLFPGAPIGLGIWQGEHLRDFLDLNLPLQGNLDPEVLLRGGKDLDQSIDAILKTMKGRPHIFNLGHGILKDTPISHVEQMIKRVRKGSA